MNYSLRELVFAVLARLPDHETAMRMLLGGILGALVSIMIILALYLPVLAHAAQVYVTMYG